jgi:hypothetical protein
VRRQHRNTGVLRVFGRGQEQTHQGMEMNVVTVLQWVHDSTQDRQRLCRHAASCWFRSVLHPPQGLA